MGQRAEGAIRVIHPVLAPRSDEVVAPATLIPLGIRAESKD